MKRVTFKEDLKRFPWIIAHIAVLFVLPLIGNILLAILYTQRKDSKKRKQANAEATA